MGMTTITFEAATLQDAIKRAARVAPTSGEAFDKFPGIALDISPEAGYITIRATNGIVWFQTIIDALGISGAKTTWRFPSKVFAAVIDSFPSGHDKEIKLEQVQNQIIINSAKTKAKLNLIAAGHYPEWRAFDTENMTLVSDLGVKLSLVEWAASDLEEALNVRITAEAIFATDKYKLARAPLTIGAEWQPVTIPAGQLRGVIPANGDTKIKCEGTQLLIAPDEYSQVRINRIGLDYPGTDKVMWREHPNSFKIDKNEILNSIKRANAIRGSDAKQAQITFFIGKGEFVSYATDKEGGLQDIIEISGGDHERAEFLFNPYYVIEALNNAPDKTIVVSYEPGNKLRAWRFSCDSYECWVSPMKPGSKTGS
jgi:DNA polymerase III sliding clamp (beta) subunit (PCNA family)